MEAIHPGEVLTLVLYVLDENNEQAIQPANFPKVSLTAIKPDTTTEILLTDTVMTQESDSSYFLHYTIPVGTIERTIIKARYTSDVEGDIETQEESFTVTLGVNDIINYNLYAEGNNTTVTNESVFSGKDVLYRNQVPFEAFSFNKVEIYDNPTCTGTPIEIITSFTITGLNNNEYNYTAAIIPIAGTYYAKAFIVLVDGEAEKTFINPVYNREVGMGGDPALPYETTRVYLNVSDCLSVTDLKGYVNVTMNLSGAELASTEGNVFIKQETERFRTNDSGQVYHKDSADNIIIGMDLIPTELLVEATYPSEVVADQIYYNVDILGKAKYKIKIPKNTPSANFFDLDQVIN